MNLKPSAAAIALLATCVLIQQAHCQQPHPPRMTKTDWVLLTADASSRTLDVYSTHLMLTRGCHEVLLPRLIADHTPVMAAYSAGVVALDYFAARRLERHHRKLAKIVTVVDIGQDAPWAVHNLFIYGKKARP